MTCFVTQKFPEEAFCCNAFGAGGKCATGEAASFFMTKTVIAQEYGFEIKFQNGHKKAFEYSGEYK